MIKFIKGSVFETEEYGLDALVVFIPCGLTFIRWDCKDFVKQFGQPIELRRNETPTGHQRKERDSCQNNFALYRNSSGDKAIEALKYVLVDTNESNIIYGRWDVYRMVSYSLNRLRELGVQHIGMNGIRTTGSEPEALLVEAVLRWLRQNEHEFRTIHFIDKRGGFNRNPIDSFSYSLERNSFKRL